MTDRLIGRVPTSFRLVVGFFGTLALVSLAFEALAHDANPERPLYVLVGGTAGSAGVVFLIALAAARRLLRRTPAISATVAAWCLGACILAAAPVSARWHDGCNDHDAILPLANAIRVALTHPTDPRPAYSDASEAMYCGPAT